VSGTDLLLQGWTSSSTWCCPRWVDGSAIVTGQDGLQMYEYRTYGCRAGAGAGSS